MAWPWTSAPLAVGSEPPEPRSAARTMVPSTPPVQEPPSPLVQPAPPASPAVWLLPQMQKKTGASHQAPPSWPMAERRWPRYRRSEG
ncbi:MAG: hypothetical protein H0W68_09170 [Gemmatimonadaceae bacterium]|nr:hypothetical protein [Gemmatimonadaceae bacterium]